MISILYCEADGIYSKLLPADALWTERRDARLYSGPGPVVAHPPCNRWSRMAWSFYRETYRQDGGCFQAALDTVHRTGGVIEHPALSGAWGYFRLQEPKPWTSWVRGLYAPGWSAHVWQAHYGHPAPKPTWLYWYSPFGKEPPPIEQGARPLNCKTTVELQSRKQRIQTPVRFAELLISLAMASVPEGVR